MKILIIGSGGREHALAWKLKQSPLCSQLFIAPGNPGTGGLGTNVNIGTNNFDAIAELVAAEGIGMVIIGPEDPLVNGLVDFLRLKHPRVKTIGPAAIPAQLEGSKAFAKEFMMRNQIPTAAYKEFTAGNFEEGKQYLQQHALPIVLKADGLAAGKGVVICHTHQQALAVFEQMIVNRQFGDASAKVVVEQFLDGIEVSVFAITDGTNYQIIGHAKDYKQIGEGNTGLNTGGMGCVSPVPFVQGAFMDKVLRRIVEPTINGFAKEGYDYKGFVFFGLIKVGEEPFVIEYNCRMGDPETEVVLPRLKNDLVELFLQIHNGTLATAVIKYDERAAATVMAVSGGYPEAYKKQIPVTALPQEISGETMIFHAGTAMDNNMQLVTNGGRVLAVTSLAPTIQQAAKLCNATMQHVTFDGVYYRKDIGWEFDN